MDNHILPLDNINEVLNFMNALQTKYYKILRVNLEDMTYVPIKDNSEDKDIGGDLLKWWNLFLKGYVHPADADACQEYMKNFKDRTSITYRRKLNNEDGYVWCFAQKMIIEDKCYFLIKKLDKDCINTVVKKDIAEYIAYYDPMFNCYNINKYKQILDNVGIKARYTLLYIYFVDVDKSNLKDGIITTNNKIRDGVELLNKYFGEDNVFHIVGMGFLIFSKGTENDLIPKFGNFYKVLKKQNQMEILATYYTHPKDEPHSITLKKTRKQLKVLVEKNNKELEENKE